MENAEAANRENDSASMRYSNTNFPLDKNSWCEKWGSVRLSVGWNGEQNEYMCTLGGTSTTIDTRKSLQQKWIPCVLLAIINSDFITQYLPKESVTKQHCESTQVDMRIWMTNAPKNKRAQRTVYGNFDLYDNELICATLYLGGKFELSKFGFHVVEQQQQLNFPIEQRHAVWISLSSSLSRSENR